MAEQIVPKYRDFVKHDKEYRLAKPTQKQIKDTYELLKEFKLNNVVIPDFDTVAQLHNWQTKYIKEHL